MKHLKIYLAGKMSGLTFDEMNEWRKELKRKLLAASEYAGYNVTVVNPVDYYNFEDIKYQSEREVEDYDLAHVVSSDIVIVNVKGLDSSDGTKIELHDANYHNRIPVIALDESYKCCDLHPWIKRDITRVEHTMENLVQYIKDFYMI